MSTAPRQFRSKLEEALTAKQEFEAKVSTLDEKVKLYEAEINDLKLRVSSVFHLFNRLLMLGNNLFLFSFFLISLLIRKLPKGKS